MPILYSSRADCSARTPRCDDGLVIWSDAFTRNWAAPRPASVADDALSALINLGYRRAEAQAAIGRVVERLGDGAALDGVIRDSLRELARAI